jgi:hypothetical protein
MAVDEDLPIDPSPGRSPLRPVVIRTISVTLAGLALFFVLFDAAIHSVARSADNATVLLEGQAMVHGNVLLHGWTLSLDSFWSIDAIFYAFGVGIVGLQTDLLYAIPAVMVAIIVLIGAGLAMASHRGLPALVAGLVTAGLLALPTPDLSYFILQGPWHVGTTLWCLLSFVAFSRGRYGWCWVAGVFMLVMGLVGDLATLAIGVVPCMAGAVVAAIRSRSWRDGAPTFIGAACSIVVALVVRLCAQSIGTFSLAYRNVPLRLANIFANVRSLPSRLGGLLGTTDLPLAQVQSSDVFYRTVHIFGAAAVVVGVGWALVHLVEGLVRSQRGVGQGYRSRVIDDLLLCGAVGGLLLFVCGAPNGRITDSSFLSSTVIFGVILAGRGAGQLFSCLTSPRLVAALGTLCIVCIGVFGVQFGTELVSARPVNDTPILASFLANHHLNIGVGDYPTSPLVTVASHDGVLVRPVVTVPGGHLVADTRQETTAWYADQTFQFFVYNAAQPWRDVTSATAIKTFGTPNHVYDVGPYRVLTWNHPITVKLTHSESSGPLHVAT